MSERFDPGGRRLPIKLDATSNGEFLPRPVAAGVRYANRLARENATGTARKLGLGRRAFLKSICGAAATLLSMNEAFARCGKTGGFYALPREAAFEPAAARERIGGEEFIFDIQTHHVNPKGSWRRLTNRWTYILRFFPQARLRRRRHRVLLRRALPAGDIPRQRYRHGRALGRPRRARG